MMVNLQSKCTIRSKNIKSERNEEHTRVFVSLLIEKKYNKDTFNDKQTH